MTNGIIDKVTKFSDQLDISVTELKTALNAAFKAGIEIGGHAMLVGGTNI